MGATKNSPGGCKCCTSLCVSPIGCNGNPAYGSTVTLSLSGTFIGTCLTGLLSATRTSGGSGYTNGTGYSVTFNGGNAITPATGTFDVVSGSVTNLVITNPGQYTVAPTIAFSGAGAGTGAAATVTLSSTCCFQITTGAGTYDLSVTCPTYATATTTAVVVAGVQNTKTVTMTPDTGYMCGPCVYPTPSVVVVHDPVYGDVSIPMGAPSGGFSNGQGIVASAALPACGTCAGQTADLCYKMSVATSGGSIGTAILTIESHPAGFGCGGSTLACSNPLTVTHSPQYRGSWCTNYPFNMTMNHVAAGSQSLPYCFTDPATMSATG